MGRTYGGETDTITPMRHIGFTASAAKGRRREA